MAVTTTSTIGLGSYSLREAALILRIPFAKLRRWAAGYWYSNADEERFSVAVVPGHGDELEERILSFYELMELAVVSFYRREGVSMPVVRAARASAQALFGTEFPFATKHLRTDGRGIFADLPTVTGVPPERLKLELSNSQLTYTALVEPFLREQIDFAKNGLATTYWPLGRERPVLLDAHRSFGRPIAKSNGTPTFVLFEMHQGGETLERIAAWYSISLGELTAALEFEDQLRTAA